MQPNRYQILIQRQVKIPTYRLLEWRTKDYLLYIFSQYFVGVSLRNVVENVERGTYSQRKATRQADM
jgi:hypothetical protein